MPGIITEAEDLLSGTDLFRAGRSEAATLLRLGAFVAMFGFGYGAVMGTFGGVVGERLLQVIFSALKVPMLLLVTFLLSLPSFFVLNTLFGLRADFSKVLEGLFATQAGLTIVLFSLAPFTVFWYASSASYDAALLFNGFMFAIASLTAQWLLRRYYGPLIAKRPRHRMLLRLWLVIYVFVGIQMAWVLRPFVGNPAMPVQFFRKEAWGNAYVELGKKFSTMLIGD